MTNLGTRHGRRRGWAAALALAAAPLAAAGCDGSEAPVARGTKPAVSVPAATGDAPLLAMFGAGAGAPELAESDRSQLRAAEARAYGAPEGRPVHWQNPRSGVFGEIVALGGARRQGDRVCREFRHMVMVSGRSFEARGPACGRAAADASRQG